MTPQKRPKRPWSRGDKTLMIVSGLLLALALGGFFWNRAANTLPAALPPPHPMPAVNARDYYIAATNALVETNKIDNAVSKVVAPGTPVYTLKDKEKLVAENTRALALLHQGFQYPYQEPPVQSFMTPFLHYQKIRQLARFLSLDGQVKAAQGNWGGAVNADLDTVQMGETLPRGGPLVGMLVGTACEAIGRKHAWETVLHLSAAEARAAERRLEAIRAAHVPFADTMQEEKWGTQASLREVMAQPDWASRFVADMSGRTATFSQDPQLWVSNGAGAAYIGFTGKGRILANNAQWMDQAIAQARQPYAAHPALPPLPNDLVNQLLLPVYSKVRLNDVRSATQNALLVTTLALQAYRQDHGAYPATLDALVPGYLNAVPDDPFALSGPLRYKLRGKNHVLYSVGPDGKDNGGKAIFDSTVPAPSPNHTTDGRRWIKDDSKGDVVAGVNVI